MKKLACMERHMDGAHRGLADWYEEIESGIREALISRKDFTTGWYSSKHGIASARITLEGRTMTVEASVSDDFDTPGYGTVTVPGWHFGIYHNIDFLRERIYEAWDLAEADRKENRTVLMFNVFDPKGNCVETYLLDNDPVFPSDHPPGDYYPEYGWQGECEIPEKIKQALEEGILRGEEPTFKGWTIKGVED